MNSKKTLVGATSMHCKMTLVTLALIGAYPVLAQTVSGTALAANGVRFDTVNANGSGLGAGNSNLPNRNPRALDANSAKVASVRLEIDRDGIPADGRTPAQVTVRLLDAQGQALTGVQYVTVETSGGRIQLPGASTDELGQGRRDVDRVIPGVQVKVTDGVAQFLLLAPDAPQDVTVRVTAGAAEVSGKLSYLPELREMVATGLIEGVINISKLKQSAVQPARTNDGFEYEIDRWSREWDNGKRSAAARTAFFLKGKVKGEYLLTMAFDSDKETKDRLFRDISPDEFYPIYGDSAIIGFDARSQDRFYLRVDKNKSYLLYGDFTTGNGFTNNLGGGNTASLAQRQLGNYSRSITGLKHHYESGDVTTNAFALYDSVTQVVNELPGRGVSGPYAVSNPQGGIQNSEKVELLVRDRNQPSVILSVTPMSRFADYVFEPFSGQLLFTQPVPTVDANLNPVSIRVTYEVDQGGDKFWTAGVDGQVKLGDSAEVGGSFVKEDNPLAPYRMGSANVGLKFGDKTRLVAEVARTDGAANAHGFGSTPVTNGLGDDVSGNAARVELRHQSDGVEARAYAMKADDGFNNPAAGVVAGRTEAGLKATATVTDKTQVYAEVLHSKDNASDGKRDAGQLGLKYRFTDQIEGDIAFKRVKEDGNVGYTLSPGQNTFGTGIGNPSGGFYNSGATAVDPLSGLPIVNGVGYNPGLNANAVPQDSTSIRARLTYRPNERWAAFGEVEQDIEDSDKKRAALGVDYQFAERKKVYARYENQTGLQSMYALNSSEKSNAFIVGVDAGLGDDAQVYSEYRMRDAVAERQLQAASGVRNTWSLAEGLRVQAGVERLKVLSGDAQSSTAITMGVEYTANPLWKSSARLEWRKLDDSVAQGLNPALIGNQAWLSTVMVARKLSRDWTALGRNYLYHVTTHNGGSQLQDRLQLGVAYRDTDNNRVNALARYEYKVERDNTSQDVENRRVHIFSTHADYHPHRQWWMTGRLAGKHVNETFGANGGNVRDTYSALLASGRLTYDINDKWDVGVMVASLYSPKGRTNQWAYGVEAGYQVQKNLWVSLGYNVAGFNDRDLTANEYTNRGVYVRMRFKFDETLFDGAGK